MSYAVGRGGVDVAKEVGAGNVPIGGIVADAPIVVRQNGVPVKMVAVFGGKGFMQLVVRADSDIEKPADLKGKTITVMSFQDTTFYALLGLLASAGLTKDDVDIQAAGPVGVWQMVATGKSAGMAGVPDWIPPVEAAGVAIKVIPTDEFFPHMAQAIAASDQIIKDKPDMVRAFVKAALHGMKDIMDDPEAAATDFVKFVPEWTGKEGQVKEAFAYYDKLVYPGQKELGAVDPDRLAKLQDFYLPRGSSRRKRRWTSSTPISSSSSDVIPGCCRRRRSSGVHTHDLGRSTSPRSGATAVMDSGSSLRSDPMTAHFLL